VPAVSAERKTIATVLIVVMAAMSLVAARPVGAGEACTDPFTPALAEAITTSYPDQRVTAAVHDTRTGCWYHLHPGTEMQTASVIKVQFLAGVLLRAQELDREVTAWEQERIEPMMARSHNPPASELFLDLGGVAGQEALDERFGLTATTSTSKWGATVSTAHDRTRLALAVLHGGGPLGADARERAWQTMTAVHPTQRWGISAGVPEGWSVALKNGFYPTSGIPAWRIGSTGFVRDDLSGEGYAITVMTDQNPGHATGQALVEQVAEAVARTLTGGDPVVRDVDRSVCVAVDDEESWPAVAARLGVGDAATVRSVSGGPPSPLAGMQACRDELASYDPEGPSASYVSATYRTFLSRDPSRSEQAAATVSLETGVRSRIEHTRSLASSMEWIGRTIDDIYRSALGREADDGGRRYWRDRVVAGMRITDVGAYIYGSDELYALAGGTDRELVHRLYQDLLHREPDQGGIDHWTSQLQAGTDRATVAGWFYASPESRHDRVAATYRSVLARSPESAGLLYWADQLLGIDDVALAASLAASDEFFGSAQP